MKTKIEAWDESILEIEDYQVERALTNAALDAIRRARQFGTDYVIWEGGAVKSLRPDQTAPHEKQLLEELDRINRKIAELQTRQPSALELNDKPDKPS
jgi:DNA-directed RNA polymerase specialized sigma24 family protein